MEINLFNLFVYGQALSQITSTGAMTYSFIQAIEQGHGTTYGNMLNAMRSTIRNTGSELGGGIVTSLLTMLLTGGSLSGGMRQVCLSLLALIFVVLHTITIVKAVMTIILE